VMAMTGATIGKVGRVRSSEPSYLNQRVAKLSAKAGHKFDDFVFALVTQAGFDAEVINHSNGSAQANISTDGIGRILVPDFPPEEQLQIGRVIGALDDKIELNRRMNETLEALAQSLFKSWFVDATQSALPKGWREVKLSECCENIFSGGTPSTQIPAYWNGELPWLSSGETRNKFILETEKTITQEGVANSSTRLAKAGSTVIASAGQGHTRGQTSFLTFDSYVNQSVVVLVANKAMSSDMFLFFDLERRYQEFRAISDSHSIRGSLTTKLLGGLTVILPPRDLISKFDEAVLPMTNRIISNLKESHTLDALRDALLPKLLSGELRVSFSVPSNPNQTS